jgi:hypothetical protein
LRGFHGNRNHYRGEGSKVTEKGEKPSKKAFSAPPSAKEDGKKKGKRAQRKETQPPLITFLADKA